MFVFSLLTCHKASNVCFSKGRQLRQVVAFPILHGSYMISQWLFLKKNLFSLQPMHWVLLLSLCWYKWVTLLSCVVLLDNSGQFDDVNVVVSMRFTMIIWISCEDAFIFCTQREGPTSSFLFCHGLFLSLLRLPQVCRRAHPENRRRHRNAGLHVHHERAQKGIANGESSSRLPRFSAVLACPPGVSEPRN